MLAPEVVRDDRPDVYPEGRYWVYRASAIGGCIRALLAARLGFNPVLPPTQEAADILEEALEYGRAQEEVILDELRADGWTIEAQQTELEIRFGNVIIRGHLDAVASKNGQRRGVEIKTAGKDRFQRFVRHGLGYTGDPVIRKWAYQVSFYMARTGLPWVVVTQERVEQGRGALHFLWLDRPPVPVLDILRRVKKVEQLAQDGALSTTTCDVEHDFFCPFRYLCVHPATPEEQDAMRAAVIDEWAEKYLRGQALEKQGKALKDEARAQLLELVGKGNKTRTERYQVSFSTYQDVRYDTAAMEAHFGSEALAPFKKTVERDRISVRPLREDEAFARSLREAFDQVSEGSQA